MEIPGFQFTEEIQIKLEQLETSLSPTSYRLLLDLMGIEIDPDSTAPTIFERIVESTATHTEDLTYDDIKTLIANDESDTTQLLAAHQPTTGNQTLITDGIKIPVGQQPNNLGTFEAVVCHNYATTADGASSHGFNMEFNVPDNSWEVAAVESSVNFLIDETTIVSEAYEYDITENTVVLSGIMQDVLLTDAFFAQTNQLKIDVFFSNGAVKSFEIKDWKWRSCIRAFLTDVQDPVNMDQPGGNFLQPINSFIPSGFGMRQLGIADYKKVEQTVQGYVEGEVAAIENIMAREYKEKATRRLRRSENTTTTSSESEKEKLTDTTSTDRYEMQSEVAKVIAESQDIAGGVSANYGMGKSYQIGVHADFATNTSSEDSSRVALTQAKEITERALDRIVVKVKEERIEKIIEEYEENNKHGFDNTKGDKHVVGVYRWVDKVFRNQIYNYGKRLMLEFMIPQPAKLHLLGMEANQVGKVLEKPVDPRTFEDAPGTPADNALRMNSVKTVSNTGLHFWAAKYNAEISVEPVSELTTGNSFNILWREDTGAKLNAVEANSGQGIIKVPDGYEAYRAKGSFTAVSDNGSGGGHILNLAIGDVRSELTDTFEQATILVDGLFSKPYQKEVPVSFTLGNHVAGDISASVVCRPTPESIADWKQSAFTAIVSAYEKAMADYETKMAEASATEKAIKEANPGFYRQIENMVLRKNCISYMIDQNPSAATTYGQDMFKPLALGSARNFGNHEVNVTAALDHYASLSKFMEQAFEWDIMSYFFYPFYWGKREDWGSLYQYDNNDPLFRSFMQAGMARVVVTVRPGFEDAVRFYLQTGQIWNGGEVPVIDNELFVSIVAEMQQPTGEKEGPAWPSRVPTSLTILQADSIGLKVERPLPFDQAGLADFEDPSLVPQSQGLEITYEQLGNEQTGRILGRIEGSQGKIAKIVLKKPDGTVTDLTYCDTDGYWELNSVPTGDYQLLLDANDDFPTEDFQVTQGSKEVAVELSGGQLLEVNLTVAAV